MTLKDTEHNEHHERNEHAEHTERTEYTEYCEELTREPSCADVYKEGRSAGFREGIVEGFSEGLTAGIAKGRTAERAKTVEKLLRSDMPSSAIVNSLEALFEEVRRIPL